MFKKNFVIISLIIVIGTFMATGAYSWPLPTTGGWPYATYNTITIEQLVKKLNLHYTCGDSGEEPCEYLTVDVTILEAQATQCNGGENCGGLGQPFDIEAVSLEYSINPITCQFEKNGNALCTKTIPNGDILTAIGPQIDDLLQNPNWSWDPESVVAPTIEITVKTYGTLKDGTEGIGDTREACFQLPQGFIVGVETAYDLICESLCYPNGVACDSNRLPFYE